MSDTFCTTREAAALLGVSVATVQSMVESGKLQAWKTEGGHRRIYRDSVEALLRQRNDRSRPLDVLVTEDNPALRKLMDRMLTSWGLPITVETAENGVAALMRIARRTPDLLITDLMMPEVDGFSLIRQLRADAQTRQLRIIVVSALDAAQINERGGLPDNVTVLGKPIAFDQLEALIRGLLLGRDGA
ncbi:response regulator [Chitinimonas sp.]|uniref:response regulator n=1 Tax=Chitinimonas sp. TaxID=1934313 RepID=UPI0035AFEBA0